MSADTRGEYLHHTGSGRTRDEGNGNPTYLPSAGGINPDGTKKSMSDMVRVLLGPQAQLTDNKSFDLDRVYGSAPHNSLGLQVAISGRADVVQYVSKPKPEYVIFR